jgi:cation diffusion facilitator family transporter
MKKTEKAELISIIASVFMAAAMLIVARLSGSVGILAEGIDTVVDVVASLAVLAGMKLSERHTRAFPQGLYKLENMIAVTIGVLIVISAWELARESIERILEGNKPVTEPWLVIIVMTGVVVITGGLAWYKNKVGKEDSSPSLRADARHSRTDVLASGAVAGGVVLQMVGIPHMDSVAALIVVAALFWSGVQVILYGLRVLLDASIEKGVLDQVRECAMSVPGVEKITKVEGRNSGSYRFVRVEFVPYSTTMGEAEKAADHLKKVIRDRIEHIDRVDVEFSLDYDGTAILAVPLAGDGASLSGGFGSAPYFRFLEIIQPGGRIIQEETFCNPFMDRSDGRDIGAAVFLARQGVTTVLAAEKALSQGALYVLEANNVVLAPPPEGAADIDGVRRYLERG